jgi:hypothetical protein
MTTYNKLQTIRIWNSSTYIWDKWQGSNVGIIQNIGSTNTALSVWELDVNKSNIENERGGYETCSSLEGCMLFYHKSSE